MAWKFSSSVKDLPRKSSLQPRKEHNLIFREGRGLLVGSQIGPVAVVLCCYGGPRWIKPGRVQRGSLFKRVRVVPLRESIAGRTETDSSREHLLVDQRRLSEMGTGPIQYNINIQYVLSTVRLQNTALSEAGI